MCISRLVGSDSLRPHGLYRLLCPWDSPGKNTGVVCHAFLQGTFPTQGWVSQPGSPTLQADSLPTKPTSAHSVQFSSVAQSCLTLWDPMDCSKLPCPSPMAQTHVYRVGDAIQPSHPLLFSSPPAFNLSQHEGLFQWVSSLQQVAKVLISSCIVSGCFCITIAELSHYNEYYKA